MSQTQRSWGRFASSVTALAAVLFGIPAFLIACSRLSLGSAHPIPGVGSASQISEWFERKLSTTEMVPILLRTLLCVGWVLWALLAMSVISAVITSRPRFSHWSLPSLPVFDGFSGWVAVGLTAVSSFAPNMTAFAADSSGPPVPQSVYATLVVDDATASDSSVADVVPDGYVRVLTGESIQKVAQRTLGDADRWEELWELRGEQQDNGTGTAWTQPWRIEADWLLKVPTSTPTPPVAAPAAGPASLASFVDDTSPASAAVTVKAGGSYWRIAEQQLGADAPRSDVAALMRALRAHNAPLLGYDDPNMVHPGDQVVVDVEMPSAVEATPADAVVVEPGDSYWEIAVDAQIARTGEIPGVDETAAFSDALVALNAPRLGYDDPTLILPGDLVFTNLETTPEVDAAEEEATEADAAPVVDELPSPAPAEADAETSTPTPTVDVEVNEPVDETGGVAAAVESDAAETDVAETAPQVTAADVVPVDAPAAVPLPAPDANDARSDTTAASVPGEDLANEGRAVAALAGLSALAAAGLGLRLAARRLRARRRCRPGERPTPVPDQLDDELAAVAYRDVSDVTWMSLELRWLAHQLSVEARSEMVVQLVQLGDERTLEVAFTQVPPVAPPAGWAVAADRVWALPAPHDPAELAEVEELPPVLPALVTLGDASEGGQVFLNAEAAAGLNITGDAEATADWIRNAVWEIAGAALAERPTVRVIASDLAVGLSGVADVEIVEPEALFEELSDVFADGDVQLHRSMLAMRTNEWEAWPPALVIAGVIDDADTDRWEAIAAAPWVACFTTTGTFAQGLEVEVAAGEISVPAFGLKLPAAQLTAAVAAVASETLSAIDADPVVDEELVVATPAAESTAEDDAEAISLTFAADDWEAPEWPVMVHVLGEPEVTVDGELKKLTPQQVAMLALLAIKREVSIDDLKRAIWSTPKKVERIDPDSGDVVLGSNGKPEMVEVEVTPHRVRDALSDLRKAVGGTRVVSSVTDKKVSAGPDLGCDTMLFEALNKRAEQEPASTAVRLHEMVLLVRGPAFGYAPSSLQHWRWVDLAQLQATWEGRVVTAAHTLAGMYLASGDAGGARNIAEQGLSADPLNSALTERLMEAYAQLGSIDSAQRVYEAHDRAMIDFGGATPETRIVLDRIRAATRHSGGENVAQSSA